MEQSIATKPSLRSIDLRNVNSSGWTNRADWTPKKKWFQRIDNWQERAVLIGALWGAQMQRQFGWEWINMIQHDHDDLNVVAMFDMERTVGIYPFHYVFGCFENKVYPTVLLAFNMLLAGKVPKFDRRSYENLMDGVQHIVPPR